MSEILPKREDIISRKRSEENDNALREIEEEFKKQPTSHKKDETDPQKKTKKRQQLKRKSETLKRSKKVKEVSRRVKKMMDDDYFGQSIESKSDEYIFSGVRNEELLGEGLENKVYRAIDKSTEKEVLIFRAKQSQEHYLENHARILSKLQGKEGFLKILHFSKKDSVFMICEDPKAMSLEDEIENLDLATRMDIVLQLGKLLQTLHQEVGILHRDLKPDQLYLTKENDKYKLMLSDFGVASDKGEIEVQFESSLLLGTLRKPAHATAQTHFQAFFNSTDVAQSSKISKKNSDFQFYYDEQSEVELFAKVATYILTGGDFYEGVKTDLANFFENLDDNAKKDAKLVRLKECLLRGSLRRWTKTGKPLDSRYMSLDEFFQDLDADKLKPMKDLKLLHKQKRISLKKGFSENEEKLFKEVSRLDFKKILASDPIILEALKLPSLGLNHLTISKLINAIVVLSSEIPIDKKYFESKFMRMDGLLEVWPIGGYLKFEDKYNKDYSNIGSVESNKGEVEEAIIDAIERSLLSKDPEMWRNIHLRFLENSNSDALAMRILTKVVSQTKFGEDDLPLGIVRLSKDFASHLDEKSFARLMGRLDKSLQDLKKDNTEYSELREPGGVPRKITPASKVLLKKLNYMTFLAKALFHRIELLQGAEKQDMNKIEFYKAKLNEILEVYSEIKYAKLEHWGSGPEPVKELFQMVVDNLSFFDIRVKKMLINSGKNKRYSDPEDNFMNIIYNHDGSGGAYYSSGETFSFYSKDDFAKLVRSCKDDLYEENLRQEELRKASMSNVGKFFKKLYRKIFSD